MRRRLFPGCLALLVLTGLILALPVFSAPRPEPVPVHTATDEVAMGSMAAPAADASVQSGSASVASGAAAARPVLTVTRTQVRSFSMLGVTWAFDAGITDTVVRVRVQNAAGTWGHWTEVGQEDAAPNADAQSGAERRGGTAPVWTGPSTGVQAELSTRSGAAPADVRLQLIDPGQSAADSSLEEPAIRDTAHAASSMPPVFSRAQWGADERIRTWDPEYASTIKAATIHHTADSNDYTAAQVPALMRAMYRYHTVSRGWGDIGYNVIVDKFGRMWEGRYGGLASTVIGAHAGGFNTYTFGVSMLGNYDVVGTPAPMISAVESIVAWKFGLYGVNPLGKTTLTSGGGGTAKYAQGVNVTLPTIFAHRDVGATACPGRYGYARMGEIRTAVASKVIDLTLISRRYNSDASLHARLGAQRTAPTYTADGSGGYAVYQNGSLYYSRATGVHLVTGPTSVLWTSLGAEAGILHYPTADVAPTADGVGHSAAFQGGSIVWSRSTPAQVIRGPILTLWNSMAAQAGPLGYPKTSVGTTADGVGQYAHFQKGSIFWSPATGARALLSGPILSRWAASGYERGALGYPTSGVGTTSDGTGQYAHFQRGSIFSSSSTTGAQMITAPVNDRWAATGYERGPLGYPTSEVTATADNEGRVATFQKGSIYWTSTTGAQAMTGPVGDLWAAGGAERGALGYPTSSVAPTADGKGQYADFQRGSVYSSAAGAHAVSGPVQALWMGMGSVSGALGYPAGDATATTDHTGQYVPFEKGAIYSTDATGVRAVAEPIWGAWNAHGGAAGLLGYPTTNTGTTADGTGRYQHFQSGSVFWSPTTEARVLSGPVRDLWASTGYERGPLGYPTSDVTATVDGKGRYATFQKGYIYSSSATRAHMVLAPLKDLWASTGYEHGPLGYPTMDTAATGDRVGRYEHFQKGSIFWSPTTGPHSVLGAFLTTWARGGYERGPLGYPTKDAYTASGGARMDFQHGSITVSSTGKVTVVPR